MSVEALLHTLRTNRYLRSEGEVAAFEQALFELAKEPDTRNYLAELYLIYDDATEDIEVMAGLQNFIESFDVEDDLQALAKAMPILVRRAKKWAKHIHRRYLRSQAAREYYKYLFPSISQESQNTIRGLLEEISKENLELKQEVEFILS